MGGLMEELSDESGLKDEETNAMEWQRVKEAI